MDFTISKYKSLLKSLISQGYTFQTYAEYLNSPADRVVLLRHDVDKRPENSFAFAVIENEMGVAGTYYFRILPCSFNESIITIINNLGHEIGYHYEDMDLGYKRLQAAGGRHRAKQISEIDLADIAIDSFSSNLLRFRNIAPIDTICMHGSPLSKYDNRHLWKYYNYREYGLVGEPYFDTDFEKVLYLSDTGRRWDGSTVSIRDKVKTTPELLRFHFRSTASIISSAENGLLPDRLMLTLHPQRWTSNPLMWVQEIISQNLKNVIKWALINFKKNIGLYGQSN